VVNAALAGLLVDVKVLEVVVEIDRAGAEVAAEERRVRRKDGRHVDMALAAERDGEAGLPLVEVSDDGRLGVVDSELQVGRRGRRLASARAHV
jgi:hypothetical protein